MAQVVKVRVDGVANVAAMFKELAPKVQKQVAGRAMYAAAKLIRDQAKANVGRGGQFPRSITGLLAKSLVVVKQRRAARGHVGYYVEVKRGKARYANTAKNRRRRRVGKSYTTHGAAYYGAMVELGTRRNDAFPFQRPAFEEKKYEASQRAWKELAKGLADVAAGIQRTRGGRIRNG